MRRKNGLFFAGLFLFLCASVAGLFYAAGQETYDLTKVAAGQGWTVVGRGALGPERSGSSSATTRAAISPDLS